MPQILFVHQNFPAQFGALARHLAAQGWNVLFATAREGVPTDRITRLGGVRVIGYQSKRDPDPDLHRYLRSTESAILNGQGFAETAVRLKRSGYTPDLVVAHSGWGSGSFAKAIWPDTKFVQYLEWWYTYPARDAHPDVIAQALSRASRFDHRARNLCLNIPAMIDFASADGLIIPTRFQSETFPDYMRDRAEILHEGVDCTFFAPRARAPLELGPGLTLPAETPLLTYATRGMEPMRGFMEFMEALSRLQATHADFHTVIAGRPEIHYQPNPPEGDSYKKRALATWEFDHSRIHWVGLLPRATYRNLLARSDCHVYPTRNFVLSWSLIEAMASGCPLVVSDTDTVRESLPGAKAARPVNPFDIDSLAGAMAQMLDNPDKARKMGMKARARALAAYDQDKLLPRHRDYLLGILGKGAP